MVIDVKSEQSMMADSCLIMDKHCLNSTIVMINLMNYNGVQYNHSSPSTVGGNWISSRWRNSWVLPRNQRHQHDHGEVVEPPYWNKEQQWG